MSEIPGAPTPEHEVPMPIPEQIAQDYETILGALPQGVETDAGQRIQLALARLTQNAVVAYEQLEERERLVEKLQRTAYTHPVSGLPNRNAFEDRIRTAEERQRRREVLGVVPTRRIGKIAGYTTLAIDLDHFKTVNDIYGHQQGDRLLESAGHALQASIREGDELYHMGGDEFLAFMQMMRFKAPDAVAQDMRQQFLEHLQRQATGDTNALPPDMKLTETDERALRVVGATFGAHWSDGPYIDRREMYRIADENMLASKAQRNNSR
jgi:diguanylate cyclase (GGDEF)-like protein